MALFLRDAEVARCLTMDLALDAVEESLRQQGLGTGVNRPRQRVRTGQIMLQVMPAGLPEHAGFKFYCSGRWGARPWASLFDATNGELLALMEAETLGVMRTGAASGVATSYLARPDAAVLGLFGTGLQAWSQVEAVAAVRPLRQIKALGRDRAKLERFCADVSRRTGVPCTPAADARAVVDGSDIVTTITSARAPLFDGAWLAPGTHVNAAGSNRAQAREVDGATVRRAALVAVDSVEQARVESGDLLAAAAEGAFRWEQAVELGAIVAGQSPGRQGQEDITLFESHGIALWDVAAARQVYARARELGLGTELPF